MELEKICRGNGHGMDGYAVVYGIEGLHKSNHVRNTKRLIKFVNNLHKKDIPFKIFSCNTGKELTETKIHRILNIGKVVEDKLMLED